MNRKSVSIILAIVTWFLLLTGCSADAGQSGSGTSATNEAAESEETEIVSVLPRDAKIGLIYADDIGTFNERFTGSLRSYLIQADISEDNIREQVVSSEEIPDVVKDLDKEQCSVLIVDNTGDMQVSAVTDLARDAGIPILYFGTDPGEKERKRWEEKGIKAAYVGSDDTKAAQQRADVLNQMDFSKIDLNEDEEIGTIILKDSDSSDAEQINRETVRALEELGFTVNILDEDEETDGEETDAQEEAAAEEESPEDAQESENGDSDESAEEEASAEEMEKEAAYELVLSKMESYGRDLELILCANDSQAAGVWQAISEQKRLVGHDVLILGLGAGEETLREIARGNITGTLFNNTMEQAKYAADYTISFLKGIEVPYYTAVDHVNVTVDNAQEILDILSLQNGGSADEAGTDEEAAEEDAE